MDISGKAAYGNLFPLVNAGKVVAQVVYFRNKSPPPDGALNAPGRQGVPMEGFFSVPRSSASMPKGFRKERLRDTNGPSWRLEFL